MFPGLLRCLARCLLRDPGNEQATYEIARGVYDAGSWWTVRSRLVRQIQRCVVPGPRLPGLDAARCCGNGSSNAGRSGHLYARPGSLSTLVLISGQPGSGKISLGGPLATELNLPLLSKDTIKEALASLTSPDLITAEGSKALFCAPPRERARWSRLLGIQRSLRSACDRCPIDWLKCIVAAIVLLSGVDTSIVYPSAIGLTPILTASVTIDSGHQRPRVRSSLETKQSKSKPLDQLTSQ